ncbi:malto-oligosyltrehalose trehalohydrolase [Desulfonatronospira sp. MSAO_Bac3]|uniref:malto-oligosyltrehalose trehalohydrolase n=1 Tax=Desulfonatronospira sp. MSAO_Bac3 TaxID=2293857 RepID=UPI000FF6CCBD|nr:malto-oligosyltrehalose trehalohydrolase [Desulfonatronospira sp. MSAO_Bac3]RQD74401.1 MAG: malto-oligosyltrehalose trehalohydrolase [Desulfonatronospira sp. MSAO_Bac3]
MYHACKPSLPQLRVWAPRAQRVDLVTRLDRQLMLPQDNGWWQAEESPGHGEDYSFLVDGEGPFPDPRSPWQPGGIEGQSRRLDHRRFEWSDQGFQPVPLSSAVIYELHVGTFSPEGTFKGVMHRLDHLVELGVSHVELMPVAEFSGSRGWGYDGVNLYAPHHVYGHPEELKELVNACHSRGLGVILDVVYNHLGPRGNYLPRFGPYFTDRYRTPWGDAVNLDGAYSDDVRRFFIENALMWLRDYHFDGLRLDAVHALYDFSARHFLEELAWEVKELEAGLGRHLVLIAESDLNDPRVIRPFQAGGYGMHAQWNEDFHHALHAALTGESQGYYADFGDLAHLAKALEKGFVYDGIYSQFRRRRHGRPAPDICGHRYVGCLQNHDQVGNRARGERSSQLLTQGQLKMGAALVLTSPFIPMLFQGEEWGARTPFLYFTAHEDAGLAREVFHGRLAEFKGFGWDPGDIPDPQDPETFVRSRLDRQELSQDRHAEILNWYKQLIRLRREYPELTSGRPEQVRVEFQEEKRWLIMRRGPLCVACNFSQAQQTVPLDGQATNLHIVLASQADAALYGWDLFLPGHCVAVLCCRLN